ncbi:unnamed protein product [Camellia sinensis]
MACSLCQPTDGSYVLMLIAPLGLSFIDLDVRFILKSYLIKITFADQKTLTACWSVSLAYITKISNDIYISNQLN